MAPSSHDSCIEVGSALKVPFGLSTVDGRLYGPRDVARGKECSCICPGCKLPLIAKQPDFKNRIAHFAHTPGAECSAGLETSVHLAAKQIIEDERRLFLPAVIAQLDVQDSLNQAHQRYRLIAVAGSKELNSVKAEVTLDDVRPDILVTLADTNQTVLVEIAVTHFVDIEKREKLKRIGLPTLEFDLSEGRELSLQSLRDALLGCTVPVEWVYHPEVEAQEARWLSELKPILDAARQQADAEESARLKVHEAQREAQQRAYKLQRAEQQEEEARSRKARHLELVKATNFKNSPESEKLQLVARSFKRATLPASLRFRAVGEDSFGVKNPLIWQALLFRKLVQGAWETGHPGFSKEYAVAMLGYRFDIKPVFRDAENVAVWKYLTELATRGALRRDGKQFFKVMVRDLQAYETLQLYRRGAISVDHGLAWVDKAQWPTTEVTELLAHIHAAPSHMSTNWQRVSTLLPTNAESPVHDALNHFASLVERSRLIEFWISSGYLVHQVSLPMMI